MDFTQPFNAKPSEKIIGKSIFIWIDILGFSQELEKSKNYDGLINKLEWFQTNFKSRVKRGSAKVISDGIILEIENTNNIQEVFHEIAELQLDFIINKELFLRGGIASGNPVKSQTENENLDECSYVSEGLARAVKIEESAVNYPVIGTNDKFFKEIKDILKLDILPKELGLMQAYNHCGENLYFIDFIINTELNIEDMKKFEQLLINNITKECSGKIRDKYIWLLRYYKTKCKTFLNSELENIYNLQSTFYELHRT